MFSNSLPSVINKEKVPSYTVDLPDTKEISMEFLDLFHAYLSKSGKKATPQEEINKIVEQLRIKYNLNENTN